MAIPSPQVFYNDQWMPLHRAAALSGRDIDIVRKRIKRQAEVFGQVERWDIVFTKRMTKQMTADLMQKGVVIKTYTCKCCGANRKLPPNNWKGLNLCDDCFEVGAFWRWFEGVMNKGFPVMRKEVRA